MSDPPEGKPWYQRWWAIVIYTMIGLAVVGSLGGGDNPEAEALKATTTTPATTTTEIVATTTVPRPTTTQPPRVTTTPTFSRGQSEQLLVIFLRDWSLTYERLTLVDGMSDDDIIELGHTSCDALAAGNTGTDLFLSILANIDDTDMQGDAAFVLGASVEALCSEYWYLLDQ